MTTENDLYYAIQSLVWNGKNATDIKRLVAECYEEVMRREAEEGKRILREERRR